MKLRHLYLAFAVIGLVLPYSQFVPWIVEHHALNMELFIRDLFANRISAFFAMDVIVSAIVLISFIRTEGKRLGTRMLWLSIVSGPFPSRGKGECRGGEVPSAGVWGAPNPLFSSGWAGKKRL